MFARIFAVGATATAVVLQSALHRKQDKMNELQSAHLAALVEQNERVDTLKKVVEERNALVNTTILGISTVGVLLGATIVMAMGGGRCGGPGPILS